MLYKDKILQNESISKKMGTQPFRNSFELSQFQFEKRTDRAGYKWKGIFRIRKHQYPSFYREFWFGQRCYLEFRF